MAYGKDGVQFTADPSPFLKAVSLITGSMGKVVKGAGSFASNIGNSIKKSAVNFSKFALGFNMITMMFGKLWRGLNFALPEIGSAFSIMGKIIGRNLLYPLRKELIPILQNMMKWVEKNRALFAKLGGILVNVFKLVKSIYESFLRLMTPIFDAFKNFFKSIFGDTARSFTDTVNLLLFKLTTLVMAAEVMLRPLFEGLGELVEGLIVVVKTCIEGIVRGFERVAGKLHIMEGLKGIFTDLKDLCITIVPVLKILAELIGVTLAGSFKIVIDLVRSAIQLISYLFKIAMNPSKITELSKEFAASMASLGKDIGGTAATAWKGYGETFTPTDQVKDAIITKTGKVIKTAPSDNIIATKGLGKNVNVNVNFPGININVTEGNSMVAGENFGAGLEYKIRNILLGNLATEGVG